MAGRPTKLTPERQDRLLEAIRKGHSNRDACALCGIRESTLYGWLERGRNTKRKSVFLDFLEAFEQANAYVSDILLESSFGAATIGATKKVRTRKTIRGEDGLPLKNKDGSLAVEVTEREEIIPPDGGLALEIQARRRPQEWGRHVAVDHSGQIDSAHTTGPIEVVFVKPPERDSDGNVIDPKEGKGDEITETN